MVLAYYPVRQAKSARILWNERSPPCQLPRSTGSGAGGHGGGVIILRASQSFLLRPQARIEADGVFGSDDRPDSWNGRNVSPPGTGHPTTPLPGGLGAGGCILVDTRPTADAVFEPSSVITSLGADGSIGNGGTIKLRSNPNAPSHNETTMTANRIDRGQQNTIVRSGWELYQ